MTEPTTARTCPYCKEDVKGDATRCPHCRSEIAPENPGHGGVCPFCKEDVKPDALRCKHCQSDIGPVTTRSAPRARGGGGCGCGGGRGPGSGGRVKGVRRRPRRSAATLSGDLWPGGPWECEPTVQDEEGTWDYIYEDDDTCYYWGPH